LNLQLFSLILIFFLFSSIPITGYAFLDEHNKSLLNIDKVNKIKTDTKFTSYNILLNERLTVNTSENINNNFPTVIKDTQTKSVFVSLSENLSIDEFNQLSNGFSLFSHFIFTTLENIYNYNKSGKNKILDAFVDKLTITELNSITTDSINVDSIFVTDLISFENNLDTYENIFTKSFLDRSTPEIQNLELSLSTNNSQFNLVNEYVFLLLVPTIGLVFIKSENKKIDFQKSRTFLSVLLILTFSLSTVSTPFLISNSYWGYAYGEEISIEEIIQDSQNDIDLVDQTSTNIISFNATSTNIISSSATTTALGINATTTDLIDTNSNKTSSDSLATDSIMSISDFLSVTLSKFTGTTTPSDTSDSLATDSHMSIFDTLTVIFTPGFSIDDAKLSLPFDSLENATASDNAQINEENSLELDGDHDFIQVNDTSTNNLRSLVISAWIKPDYSQGSPEFTVVSKEKSFSLTVDNQISSHEAKFSIFDGIKWTQVTSTSEIPEEWTHLTASFSNQTISIYVNGELTGTEHLEGVLSLSLNGQLESVDIESVSSTNDIVVGAYITTKNNLPQPNNMFSGMIDDVLLFDSMLSESQIGQIYSEGISTHGPTQTKSLDEILREMEQEAGIYTQNSTSKIPQAQLSLSDTLSFSYFQAQIIPSNALQAQLSLNINRF